MNPSRYYLTSLSVNASTNIFPGYLFLNDKADTMLTGFELSIMYLALLRIFKTI